MKITLKNGFKSKTNYQMIYAIKYHDGVSQITANNDFSAFTDGALIGYEDSYVTFISPYVFYSYGNISSAVIPNVSYIDNYAFAHCYNLRSITAVNCTYVGSSAFYSCSKLSTINLTNLTSTGQSAFANCSSLSSISFPNIASIGAFAFRSCINLESVYLPGSTLCTLGGAAFESTPLSNSSYLGRFGSIYVPSSMLASYKAALYWSAFSDRIVGI